MSIVGHLENQAKIIAFTNISIRIKQNGIGMRKYTEYHLDSVAVSDAGREVMEKKTKNTQ